ncbi:translocation/assembly module TamB domain-containing protein [uncultured Fusobacterium sp.]|uniref:translocation/assembly module TamB domain-containing protein n=1 Tax=uncultured Fusobacterium sp. TaxID=159267 RepID=UPI0025DF853A|nr:translocation/assembly module TamB domain-containing protein [uncultured Fusobacterium sp.]
MKEFYQKNKKKVITMLTTVFVFLGGYWAVVYHLPKTIEVIVQMVLGTTISSSSIEFKENKIEVRDLKIINKKEIIIDAPKVDILYSKKSLEDLRIEEIIIYDGIANITREKNGDINIVAAFTGGTKEDKNKVETEKVEVKKEEVYKPGIAVPIDKITAINATTNFTDLSYRNPIKETAYNTNGYLTFSKETGIDMEFTGSNNGQIYTYKLNTSEQPYDMTIILKNISVRDDLLQYAYDGEEVDFNGGKLNLDLSISPKGMFGGADFKDVTVRYKDLDADVKVLDGTVDFLGKRIEVKANYEIFKTKDKFLLVFDENGELNIDFSARNISYDELKKYSLLKDKNLPLENIFIDDVKFNMNLNKENGFSVTIDYIIKKSFVENLEIENLKGNFIYDKEGLHIKKLNSVLGIKDTNIKKDLSLKLDYINSEGNIDFSLNNIKGVKDFLPNIQGSFNFDTGEEDFKFNFISNILKVRGIYFSKINKILLYRNGKYSIEYDLTKKNLERGSGVIDINLYGANLALDFIAENNKITIDKLITKDENQEKERLILTGDVDLNKLDYNLLVESNNFKLKENDLEILTTLKGKIYKEAQETGVNLDIKDFSLKYIGEINNIHGNLDLKKSKELYLDFNGEIGQLKYSDYDINGILLGFRIKNNIFELKEFENSMLNGRGTINLKTLQSNMDFAINGLSFEKFNLEYPKFYLNDIQGKVTGNINNPKVDIKINDTTVELVEGRKDLKISGNINYSDFKMKFNKIYLNTNILNGYYSIKDKKYSAILNIIEDDPSEYYSDTNLKYRVIGTVKAKGEAKKADIGIESTIDKIYLRGKRLPNIYVKGNYKTDDILTGEIKLDKIILSNSKLHDIIKLTANYDLTTKIIDAEIKNQNINLVNLEEYIGNENIKGSILVNGKLEGTAEDLIYNLTLQSPQISMQDVNFKNFLVKLNGNLDNLNLEAFSFKYLNNSLNSKGNIGLKNQKYNFFVDSSKINLDFLNIFLKKYGITNIEGDATLNLQLQDTGNKGYFKLNNFGLNYDDIYIDLNNLNSTIKLDKQLLYIENLKGILNKGDVEVKGFLELPTLTEISENPYYLEDLKYDVSLKSENIDYRYGKNFNLLFNSNFNMKNSLLKGDITILDGKVSDIPNNSKTIFQIIKNFLFKTSSTVINNSEELGEDFKIDTVFEKALELDINFRTKDDVDLDIQDLNVFVSDVTGGVAVNGNISGKNGKLLLLGDIEVNNGSLEVNGNTFKLDKAMVIFNDRKDYLPNVNPTLIIDSKVKVDNDEIGMSINGELDDLKFTITSKNGSSSGNLSSLLVGDSSEEFSDGASTTLIKTVIGSQLSQTLFKPISNLVKNTLNISKFRIKSNIMTDENSNNPNEENNRLRLGAIIEAEDNIYKDKLYWVARGNLLGDDSTDKTEKNSGAFDEYDFSIEYRFKPGRSIGIGVGKLPERVQTKSDEKTKDAINYHIDFKFEKKYDNLLDIFIK